MIYQDFLSPVLEKMPAGSKMRAAVGSDSVLILMFDNLSKLAKCFEKYVDESNHDDDEQLINDNDLGGGGGEEVVARSIPDGSMSIKDFASFTNDAGFVDEVVVSRRKFSDHGRKHSIMGNRSTSSITQKDVRQIFSASQHDNIEANESEQRKVADDDNLSSHQELMIFSEFLEAIARLGVLKYHSQHTKVGEGENDNAEVEQEHDEEALSHFECIKLAVGRVCSMV